MRNVCPAPRFLPRSRVEVDDYIIDVLAVSDRLVDGDSPRGGGPDDCMTSGYIWKWTFDDLERHIDLRAGDVLIFDLGFGERGLFDGRPHHRLGAAIELAGVGEFEQFGDDRRLGLEFHGEIGIVPVALDAEPFELGALHCDPFGGIFAAFGAELGRGDGILVELFLAILLLDLPLDRQAVAIPAGDIGCVLAEQALGARDEVLQHLVERVAHMDVAIGIRRAVMEDEPLTAFARRAQLAVQIVGLPFGEDRRLLLRQAGFHRKVGFRQEDGVFVIGLSARC